jgi:hypothetical protein
MGMLDPVEKDKKGQPLTCRAVCIHDNNVLIQSELIVVDVELYVSMTIMF